MPIPIFLDANTNQNRLEYVLYLPDEIVKFNKNNKNPNYVLLKSITGSEIYINIKKHIVFANDYLTLWNSKAKIKYFVISNKITNKSMIKLRPYIQKKLLFPPTISLSGEKNVFINNLQNTR